MSAASNLRVKKFRESRRLKKLLCDEASDGSVSESEHPVLNTQIVTDENISDSESSETSCFSSFADTLFNATSPITNDDSGSQSNISDDFGDDSSLPSEHTENVSDVDSDVDLREPYEILAEDLKQIFVKHNLTSNCLEDLLKALKKHALFEKLPARTPTLMKSRCKPQGRPEVLTYNDPQTADEREFTYFGILNGLQHQIELNAVLKNLILREGEVRLIFNTDGAPLFVKSYFSKTAWPLLCRVHHPNYRIPPFMVALHVGTAKPPHRPFLRDFVRELNCLNGNHFELDERTIKISLLLITADAPARAYLKQICGHNGRSGCEKCFQMQYKTGGIRVNFEFKEKCELKMRTHANFKAQEDVLHHKGPSMLLKLKSFDIIRQVVLDDLHLIDEGIGKKLLFYVAQESKGIFRISDSLLREMNREIASFASYTPSDFQRRLVPTKYLSNWKATSYRQFILYAGPVLLKGKLADYKFSHFLLFHCAMRILRDRRLVKDEENLAEAERLLAQFVRHYNDYFGAHKTVYCAHSLLHLVDDVRYFKLPLQDLSCYDFENFLKSIVNSVHSGMKISVQIRNRLCYQNSLDVKCLVNEKPKITQSKNGKTTLEYHRMSIRFPTNNDSYILTNDQEVLQVLSIQRSSSRSGSFILNCIVFEKVGSLYKSPIDSAEFFIFKVKKTDEMKLCSIDKVVAKIFLMPYKELYVCVPLLHTIRDM